MYSISHFPQQKADETVVFALRRHWVAVVKVVLITIFLVILPVGLLYLFQESPFMQTEGGKGAVILLGSAYYLFVILFAFTNFIDYYLDVWIVTNQRVVSLEQNGLFGRQMSEKDLGRMQDITAEVKGFWGTIFHYGDIHIQTAGEQQRFLFHQVPDAEEMTRKISNLVTEFRQHVGLQNAVQPATPQTVITPTGNAVATPKPPLVEKEEDDDDAWSI